MENGYELQEQLMILGSNIRKTREMRQISVSRLAQMTRYDRCCLSALEYGEQNVKLKTAIRLAQVLNAPFPELFSRNYLSDDDCSREHGSYGFINDNYLLVFIENYQKAMQCRHLKQIEVYSAADVQAAVVSRIINGKVCNPTLKTLYAMAYTSETELANLFMRHT